MVTYRVKEGTGWERKGLDPYIYIHLLYSFNFGIMAYIIENFN